MPPPCVLPIRWIGCLALLTFASSAGCSGPVITTSCTMANPCDVPVSDGIDATAGDSGPPFDAVTPSDASDSMLTDIPMRDAITVDTGTVDAGTVDAGAGPCGDGGVYFAHDYTGTSISGMSVVGWEGLATHPLVSGYYLNNIGGTSYAFQQIRPDPAGTGRPTLYAQIIDDDPNVSGTTRAQATLNFRDTTNLSVYHTSHRMYLSPDIQDFRQYPLGIYWFVLYEIWTQHVAAWGGDPAGSARWDLSVRKEPGAGQPLYWRLSGEYMQPAESPLWTPLNNMTAPIPLGQWITIDYVFQRGEGAAGHIVITMTPDNGSPVVLFDTHQTTIYPGHPEIILSAWQAYKLYFEDAELDWMRSRGNQIYANYNDFVWCRN